MPSSSRPPPTNRSLPTMTKPPRHPCLLLTICLAALAWPVHATPPHDPSIMTRLAACDGGVVRSAVNELFRAPRTLEEPLILFHAASGERMAGRKEAAAFLYLAAQLRTSRQILFEKGDRPRQLAAMTATVGPLIMPALAADQKLARRVVKRVIDWDRATPDPLRGRMAASSGEILEKLAEIDAALARLPDQIRNAPDSAAKISADSEQAEQLVQSARAQRCAPATGQPGKH